MLLLLLAKLLLESESWDTVQKFPTAQKSPSLPYPSGQLHQLKAYVTLDLVVLRYTHDECCSVMTSGLLIVHGCQVDRRSCRQKYKRQLLTHNILSRGDRTSTGAVSQTINRSQKTYCHVQLTLISH